MADRHVKVNESAAILGQPVNLNKREHASLTVGVTVSSVFV
jgi:hypothetical protein